MMNIVCKTCWNLVPLYSRNGGFGGRFKVNMFFFLGILGFATMSSLKNWRSRYREGGIFL